MQEDLNPRPILDEDDLSGILRRLALFEPIASIARGYQIPKSQIQKIAEERADQVRALRRGWKDWVSAAEPLCNKTNQVLFLGLCARRAALEGGFRDAIHALRDLRETMEREEKSDAQDLALLARIQLGEYGEENLGAQLEVAELLDMPHGGPFTRGMYFEPEKEIASIKDAADKLRQKDDEKPRRKRPKKKGGE